MRRSRSASEHCTLDYVVSARPNLVKVAPLIGSFDTKTS